jgi:hypothetical protein
MLPNKAKAAMADPANRTIRPSVRKRRLPITEFRVAKEVRYIQRRAAARDGRIVAIGPLVLFSTGTGDAWVLDPDDHLAGRVARDGEPEPIAFVENSRTFAISWPGSYRIEGSAFIYFDLVSGRVSTILGYPAQVLQAASKS